MAEAGEAGEDARRRAALVAVERLLAEFGRAGLARATPATAADLEAVAQIAHTAGFIRLERELAALATRLRAWLDRDPTARLGELADGLARVHLLRGALAAGLARGDDDDALAPLLGEARRKYELLAAPLVVNALAASGWVSDSGFVGITARLSTPDGRVVEASVARPSRFFGTDPRGLLQLPVTDAADLAIADLLHGAFTLTGAKLSRDLRLSLHRELGVAPAPPLGARGYAAFAVANFAEIPARLAAAPDDPVLGAEPVWVLVAPAARGRVTLDEARARATLPLTDATGAVITAEIPLRAENNLLVDNLGHLDALPPPVGIFGRAWAAEGGIRFAPVTAVWDVELRLKQGRTRLVNTVHLSLERLDRAVPA